MRRPRPRDIRPLLDRHNSARPAFLIETQRIDGRSRREIRVSRAGGDAMCRGVFTPAARWKRLAPWQRYLARVHAIARTLPGAVFILESGCALRGLPVFGEPPDVHVLLAAPAKSRAVTGVRVHSTERMPEAESIDGILVVTPAELAVGMSRARHPAVGLAVANAVLRNDPQLTPALLAATSAQQPTTRGVRALEWVLERASAVPESALESISLACIEWLGFPPPALQQWFRGPTVGDDDRTDFWWERWGVAGEADGMVKYSGELGDAREALQARNARDARLRERGVRATAHWIQSDLTAWDQARALLVAAGLPLIRPEQTGPLRTLKRALRGDPRGGRSLWR